MAQDEGIACPKCHGTETGVTDSRRVNGRIRRRRECACGRRFTTYEGMDVGEWDRVELDGLATEDRVAVRHLVKRLRAYRALLEDRKSPS
jgi:transcriptional regulator NrdR family protein